MNSPRRVRLFFFSTLFTTFIRVDKEILEKHFTVDLLIGRGFTVIPRLFFRVLRNDVALVWFASVYAFFVVVFCRMLRKPSIVVVGGTDAAKEKEVDYGIWNHPTKAKLVQFVFRNTDRILVVDPSLKESAKKLAKYNGANIEYLPTGFDSTFWVPSGHKEQLVLTVAMCDLVSRIKQKGIDFLAEAAKFLPELQFVLVGVQQDLLSHINSLVPKNFDVIPYISQSELLKYYQRAKVYCQVSYVEGLPNALCEAMLCECVPIGTTRGGIPTAIGNAGLLVSYGDVPALVHSIRSALVVPSEDAKRTRRWIIDNFPLERREHGLLEAIQSFHA